MNESSAVTIKMLASNNDTVEINAQMTCNISCDAYKLTAYCMNFDRGGATCHSHGRCNDVDVSQVGVSYQHMVMTHSRRGCRYHTDSQPHCLAMTNKHRCRTCRRCTHLQISSPFRCAVHVGFAAYNCANCGRPVKAHLGAGLPGSAVDSTSTLLEYTTAVGSMTSSSSV